jgi:hypothetical protein
MKKPSTFPTKAADTVARLRFIGEEIYGAGKWKTPMAKKLGVSRPTVNSWDWLVYQPPADLDRRLLAVLKAESAAAAERRSAMIAALKKVVANG